MSNFRTMLLQYFSERDLATIESKVIGIAGCGGLGSNCAHILTRLGFKHFVLVDMDQVEYSNLNRQFYFPGQVGQSKAQALAGNISSINPDLDIEVIHTKISADNCNEIFQTCDLVVEAFDTVSSKKMIIETLDKPLIAASGLGRYHEVYGITRQIINPRLTIIGDQYNCTDSGIPPVAPGVHIVAAKQAAGGIRPFCK